MDFRPIRRLQRPVDALFQAVPSKSVTHRALLAASLARGASTLHGPLEADDTRITRDALGALGIAVQSQPGSWVVHGCDGRVPGGGQLWLGDSGTSMRFMVALAALGARSSRLDGSARLRQRPVQELAGALQGLGASIKLTPGGGGLPLAAGGSPVTGGRIEICSSRSSQFASALLLVAPALPGGIDLVLDPPAASLPYVSLTLEVMAEFGARVEQLDTLQWRVAPGGLRGIELTIEGDHSSASYFLAIAAIAGGRIRVLGLRPRSAQPDSRLGDLLEELGCRVCRGPDWIEVRGSGRIPGFRKDLSAAPDLVPTLAVLGLFAEGPCELSGIGHLRYKESDRLAVLADNLARLGRDAAVVGDRLVIGPPSRALRGTTLGTASDHRLVMAFAIAGLRLDGVEVEDPACVSKSNPEFWTQFGRLERAP